MGTGRAAMAAVKPSKRCPGLSKRVWMRASVSSRKSATTSAEANILVAPPPGPAHSRQKQKLPHS